MKNPIRFQFAALAPIMVAVLFTAVVRADTIRIESGEIFLGGAAYETPDYQNYLRFSLSGTTRNPSRAYVFATEQQFSLYLGFPPQPAGAFEYIVQMPYSPGSLNIDGENNYPVWYSDSKWSVRMSVVTPVPAAGAPEFTIVNSPFEFSGSIYYQGARVRCLRARGSGTAQVMFQKIDTKYYFRQARLTFVPLSGQTTAAGVPTILDQSQVVTFPLGGI